MTTCDELIAAETLVHETRHEQQQQRCRLTASEWCATCRMYLCSEHVNANHTAHTRTAVPLDERRHGTRRAADR